MQTVRYIHVNLDQPCVRACHVGNVDHGDGPEMEIEDEVQTSSPPPKVKPLIFLVLISWWMFWYSLLAGAS